VGYLLAELINTYKNHSGQVNETTYLIMISANIMFFTAGSIFFIFNWIFRRSISDTIQKIGALKRV
jgi:uncharacterized membrane protein